MTTATISKIVSDLDAGETTFKFTKADGTVRTARGTTNVALMTEAARATVSGAVNVAGSPVVTYYDLDKNGWRSFKAESLLG